jgi:hypothetical protein
MTTHRLMMTLSENLGRSKIYELDDAEMVK